MTTPGTRTPLVSVKPPAPGGGLSPKLPRPKGRSWGASLTLAALLLLGFTYFLGRTVEPIRLRLVQVPLAGKLLFGAPVWQILWNKPIAQPNQAAANAQTGSAAQSSAATQQAQLALQTADLVKQQADLADREAKLKAREDAVAQLEKRLGEQIKASETLKVQLEGQLRSEKDRADVVRAMRTTSAVQLLSAMTDDEIVRILKYMDASEVGTLLNGMEPARGARILQRLTPTNP